MFKENRRFYILCCPNIHSTKVETIFIMFVQNFSTAMQGTMSKILLLKQF